MARIHPAVEGASKTYPGQDTLPSQAHQTHIQSNSDWDSLDVPIHFTCTALGCGRKPKSLEKTLADVGTEGTLHRQWP